MIIVEPRGGLANRMRVLDSAMMLAKTIRAQLVVVWNIDTDLGAKFGDLFEPIPHVRVFCPDKKSLVGKFFANILHVAIKGVAHRVSDAEIQDGKQGKLTLEYLAKHKRLHFWTWEAFWVSDLAFCDLHPIKRIVEAAKSIVSDNMIGIHIRRTDNIEAIAKSPTQLFVDAIEREVSNDPCMKFFLATDDVKEEQFLQHRFPNRMVVHQKRSLDRKESKAIQEAAIDLYCLSRCKKIYGTYWSSFSETAAKIGGIELVVLKNI
jgi:hypothetical protein